MSNKSTFQKLRESERKLRKDLIVDAAMTLFNRDDPGKIGMRDIAKQAGISAAAIYRYFPGRDEILIEALIRHMAIIERTIEEKLSEKNISLDALTRFGADYLLDNESVFQMIGHFIIAGQIDGRIRERYNEIQQSFLDLLDRVNQKAGIGNGNRLAAHAIYACILGIVMTFRGYHGQRRDSTRKHIQQLSRLVSRLFQTGTFPGEPRRATPRALPVTHHEKRR